MEYDIVGLKHNGTAIGYMYCDGIVENILLWIAVHDRRVKKIWHDGKLWNINIIGDPHRYLHRHRTLIHIWNEHELELVEPIASLTEAYWETLRECVK